MEEVREHLKKFLFNPRLKDEKGGISYNVIGLEARILEALLVLIDESGKLSKLTNRLNILTTILIILTVVLVLSTITSFLIS